MNMNISLISKQFIGPCGVLCADFLRCGQYEANTYNELPRSCNVLHFADMRFVLAYLFSLNVIKLIYWPGHMQHHDMGGLTSYNYLLPNISKRKHNNNIFLEAIYSFCVIDNDNIIYLRMQMLVPPCADCCILTTFGSRQIHRTTTHYTLESSIK